VFYVLVMSVLSWCSQSVIVVASSMGLSYVSYHTCHDSSTLHILWLHLRATK